MREWERKREREFFARWMKERNSPAVNYGILALPGVIGPELLLAMLSSEENGTGFLAGGLAGVFLLSVWAVHLQWRRQLRITGENAAGFPEEHLSSVAGYHAFPADQYFRTSAQQWKWWACILLFSVLSACIGWSEKSVSFRLHSLFLWGGFCLLFMAACLLSGRVEKKYFLYCCVLYGTVTAFTQ